MSIIVKGMDMPKACFFCECCESENYWCRAAKRDIGADPYNSVADFCPLVEVPPHGRLIDADEFLAMCFDGTVSNIRRAVVITPSVIASAPTIIEAEGEDNG